MMQSTTRTRKPAVPSWSHLLCGIILTMAVLVSVCLHQIPTTMTGPRLNERESRTVR